MVGISVGAGRKSSGCGEELQACSEIIFFWRQRPKVVLRGTCEDRLFKGAKSKDQDSCRSTSLGQVNRRRVGALVESVRKTVLPSTHYGTL